MQVPSKQELDDFIARMTSAGPDAVARMGESSWRRDVDIPALTRFLADYQHSFSQVCSELENLPASKWLMESPAGKRAHRALRGKKMNAGLAFDPQKTAERLIASAAEPWTLENRSESWGRIGWSDDQIPAKLLQYNSADAIRERLGRRVDQYTSGDSLRIWHGIASAFNGYFHTDAFVKYVQKTDARKAKARELLAAMEKLERDDLWAACGLENHAVHRVSHMKRRVHQFLERADRSRSPIGRLDSTVKERTLAFELWRLFRREFRANKTNAIFNYLLFDGIENSPTSEKPVEAWVKGWKKGGSVAYPG